MRWFVDFPPRLENLNKRKLQLAAERLIITYNKDLDELLLDKLVQFASLFSTQIAKQTCYNDKRANKILNMFCFLARQRLAATFQNVKIILRVYLCLSVSGY